MDPYELQQHLAHLGNTGALALRSPAVMRRLQQLWQVQRGNAESDCDSLLELPPAARIVRIGSDPSMVSRPLAEVLLTRSVALALRDPEQAELFVDLADHVTRRLEQVNPLLAGGPSAVRDLRALVEAHRGNALRLRRDITGARHCFARAHRLLEDGGGDVEVLARVMSLHGSLLLDVSRPRQALRCLTQAESIYRRLGAEIQRGRVLIKCANAWRNLAEPESALALTEEALECLEGEKDVTLKAKAVKNLAVCYWELGRYREARDILRSQRRLFDACPETAFQLRLCWLRAMIHQGLDEGAWAERAYGKARDGFLELGDAYNAALVSLDLAGLYLEQGRLAEVERDAAAIYPVLCRHELSAEAGAAFLLYVEAARRHRVTAHLVREVAGRLRQHGAAHRP